MTQLEQIHINDLNSILDSQLDYYEYQLCRYFNDTSMDLRGNYEYMWRNIGFDDPQDGNLAISAYFNVIKSVIDSLVSKLYNQKVRPYFTPVNGTWDTKRVVEDVQQYFDVAFDNLNVNRIINNTFRMACIFGKGFIFIDPITKAITALPPHCVSVLNSEIRYGNKPKRCMIRYLNMPVEHLQAYGIKAPSGRKSIDFNWYIDIESHEQRFFIDRKEVKKLPYKPDELPLLPLYYNEPVFGNNTVSIVQELDGIQTQIDKMSAKTSAAAQLSPANQTFVLEGSTLTPKDLSDEAGVVYGIKMAPGQTTPPVVTVTPPIFDKQWQDWLAFLIDKAYAMIGISELSAMSKKQAGLNSGVSLQTFEDIESDRFETQVTHYIQAFVNLAKLMIKVLDDDADILPQSINNSSMKWGDVRKQVDLFKIQFTPATQLSKDPSENVKTIINMSQIGQIPVYKLARSMNNPDLIEATKGAAAVGDGIQQCIARAIEKEEYDIPEFVPYQQLAQEITVVENELYASLSDDKENDKLVETSLKRLMTLEGQLLETMQEVGYVQVDQPQEAVTSEDGSMGIAPQTNVAPDITNELADDMAPKENEQEQMANGDETVGA